MECSHRLLHLLSLLLALCSLHSATARAPANPHARHRIELPRDVATADDRGPPGIQLAARQQLLEYGTQQGLEILKARVQTLRIPDAKKSFNLPLVGKFELKLSNLRILAFNVPSESARTTIQDGNFLFWVTEVQLQLGFDWHWEKLGMQGSGTGDLMLEEGDISYKFSVLANRDNGQPHIRVDEALSSFGDVELVIHSYSADWLYQAVLSLFNAQIRSAVQHGIKTALRKDVPNGVNEVLKTLPTRWKITGLPFSVAFEYSIFTLTYVLLQGYGDFASDTLMKTGAGAQTTSEKQECPYEVSPLPLSPQQVGAESHMLTFYLHQSVLNCMLWGLYNANSLQTSIRDGSVPQLHLTTDLLAMLIPELPKKYPREKLRIDVMATKEPFVTFSSDRGITLDAQYEIVLYVDNEELHVPLVARLLADLTIDADMTWDTTIISGVTAHHTVQEAKMNVPAAQWDMTVGWFIQNYAGLYPLNMIMSKFVKTPVDSLMDLKDTESRTYEGWYSLGAEVEVIPPPSS